MAYFSGKLPSVSYSKLFLVIDITVLLGFVETACLVSSRHCKNKVLVIPTLFLLFHICSHVSPFCFLKPICPHVDDFVPVYYSVTCEVDGLQWLGMIQLIPHPTSDLTVDLSSLHYDTTLCILLINMIETPDSPDI